MTMNVGEVGKRLIVNANYNMSAHTAITLEITRPGGSVFTRTTPDVFLSPSPLVTALGTFAANQYAIYRMQPGDLTVPGEYLVRIKYEDASPMVLTAGGVSFQVSE